MLDAVYGGSLYTDETREVIRGGGYATTVSKRGSSDRNSRRTGVFLCACSWRGDTSVYWYLVRVGRR